MERAVALADSDVVELDDLPPTVRGDYVEALVPSLAAKRHVAGVGEPVRAARARSLRWQQARGGRVLGISYHTLVSYLKHPAYESPGTGEWGEGEEARGADGECMEA